MLLATRCLALGPSVYVEGLECLTVCMAEKDHAENNGHMWFLLDDVGLGFAAVVDAVTGNVQLDVEVTWDEKPDMLYPSEDL